MIGYRRCRRGQLSVIWFNEVFSGAVFGLKVMTMSIAITGLGFAIKLSLQRPLLSSINCFYGLKAFIIFVTLYGDGFRIPEYMNEMNSQLRRSSMRLGNPTVKKHFRLLIASIPQVGVKVGNFRNLERESTSIFIDFVATQVASFLIGLKSR